MVAVQIKELQSHQPLVGQTPPNFKSKRDKEKIKFLPPKKERGRGPGTDRPPGQGEDLDRYI
ncbi:MAG: hypothetical protein AB1896_02725 [Thermodesulfobacteriota bacterium]